LILRKLILAFLVFCSCTLYAQDYLVNTRHFSVEEGLSSRFAISFYHDSKGFAWIGTNYGINRYDGNEFKIYTKGKNQLEDDYVREIFEDVEGNIWTVSFFPLEFNDGRYFNKSKITILKKTKNKALSFDHYFMGNSPFEVDEITYIFQDEEQVLWISLTGGVLYKYDGNFLKVYDAKISGLKSKIIPDAISGFWRLDNHRISEIDKSGEVISEDSIIGVNTYIKRGLEGGIWMSQLINGEEINEFYCDLFYKNKGEKIKPYSNVHKGNQGLINNNAYSIDQLERVWYFSSIDEKLLVLDKEGNLIQDLSYFIRDKYSESLNQIFFDNYSNAWLTTNNGVYQIILYKERFQRFMDKDGYSLRGMTQIDSTSLFVHTYKGGKILNVNTGKIDDIPELKRHFGLGLVQLENGDIWGGTYIPCVTRYSPKENKSKNYCNDKNKEKGIFSFYYEETVQKIYAGTSLGLMLMDLENDTLIDFDQYNEFEQLKDIFVHDFYGDEMGIWVITMEGVFLLHLEKGIIAHYSDFPYNDIATMHKDQDGIYWLATLGGGLIRWDLKENKTEQFTTDDGLSHDIIYAAYEDKLGYLWLPSNNGLMRFNKENKQVITYFTENGLSHNEFNRHSHYKMKDGRFVFGGLNGMIIFDPLKMNQTDLLGKAQVQIIDLKMLDGNSGELIDHTDALLSNGKIEMQPENKSFILKFALLNLSQTRAQSYAYQIDGFEKEWNYFNGNILRINQLPYGNYTLRIKGEGTITNTEKKELSIPIEVTRPFTETIFFYLLLLLGLGLLTWGYFKWRVYQLEKTNLKLEGEVYKRTVEIENDKKIISEQYQQVEELNKTKDRLFAIIGHDLRDYVSSFTGVEKKINYLIENRQLERIPQLAAYMENAASDLNLLLENLLNWAMQQKEGIPYHPDKLKIKKMSVEAIRNLYKFADDKEISILVDIPNELTAYADNNALSTIIRNLVHNAIKFSPRGGQVQISTKRKADKTHLLIQDSGIGIDKELIPELFTLNGKRSTSGTENEQGTGLGLMLCKELAEVQNGEIQVSSEKGKGSVFTVTLPSFQIL